MTENKNITKKSLDKADGWIDPDDAPSLTREWFKKADVYDGTKLVRRGRPPKANKKVSLHLRVDPEVAIKFRALGKNWQTQLNATLLNAINQGQV